MIFLLLRRKMKEDIYEDDKYYLAPRPNYGNYEDIEIEIVYTIIH